MTNFNGFTSSETFTQIPDSLFHLLKEIEDVVELKVTLYAIWRIEHIEGNFRALSEKDFEAESLGLDIKKIKLGLQKAVKRGTILRSQHEANVFYFLNSPRGRLAAETFANGQAKESIKSTSAPRERPNVFKLYEENIGPLTPLIADTLKDAEESYSQEWIVDAIALAVENNKRNWKYIEAILKRWKEEGRAEKQDRRDNKKDGQQSVDRKIEQLRKRANNK
ncbi:MAG: DnaD domain protein [Anaerolineales bacterium]|nr:DnaD domain protein [Anaerolineales bacterium]